MFGRIIDAIESMKWKNGEISTFVIKSNLGGNCRIRSYTKLKAQGKTNLKSATGENQNPFYTTPQIKKPLISDKVTPENVKLKRLIYMILKPKQENISFQNCNK